MSGAAAAASIALSMAAAGMEAKANYEADTARIKLEAQQMHIQANREMESFMANQSAISQQAFMSSASVEKARSAAQAEFEANMAGSGIGGQSVSELSADITRAAAEDQQAIKLQEAQAKDAGKQTLRQNAENRTYSAKQISISNYHQQILNAGIKTAGSMLGQKAMK